MIAVYNTNTIANLAWNIKKPLLRQLFGETLRAKVALGCDVEYNGDPSYPKLKLQDLYIQPDYPTAMANLMEKTKDLLEIRYGNQRDFYL